MTLTPDVLKALEALAELPDRERVLRKMSMEILKGRMADTFDVLVGGPVDYVLMFVDEERNAASLSNMDQEDTIRLVAAWIDVNVPRAVNDDDSEESERSDARRTH